MNRAISYLTVLLTITFISIPLKGYSDLSESLKPDLPLAAQSPSKQKWLRQAIVLQPWGDTQHSALSNVGDRPQRLKKEFGFNALIVLPPQAHNAIVGPQHRQSEEEFRAAVAAYRKAGYRLILYSAVMHCGHAPEWMSGELGRRHPEWSQLDPKGQPVTDYGAPWLCPNTGALDYTLDYTVKIAREYRADGIMLDNNQFFYTANGWTCHCEGCQKRFRQYVRDRFGDDDAQRLFGAQADTLKIPVEKGPLFALWVHWRNRVWAQVNETFRARLRQVNPKIMFFANTQYEWPDGLLASDLQYEHEDVLLSESRGLSSRHMSDKMIVGQALAGGRPLWNYIGTFEESDFTRLRPQAVVGPIIAASLAHGSRPWIVYYGFHDEQGEYRARGEMSSLLSWYAAHPELFSGRRWATVGVLLSIPSRNALGKLLMPHHLAQLLQANIPLIALRDDRLTARALKTLKVITADPSACLSPGAARLLAGWVRAGGSLIAAPDAGRFDELGRPRNPSTLEAALNVTLRTGDEIAVGKGRVRCAEPGDFAGIVQSWSRADRFLTGPETTVEVVPYRTPDRLHLHLIRHEPATGPVVLSLPESMNISVDRAEWHAPGLVEPQPLAIEKAEGRAVLRLPELPVYSVVNIPM